MSGKPSTHEQAVVVDSRLKSGYQLDGTSKSLVNGLPVFVMSKGKHTVAINSLGYDEHTNGKTWRLDEKESPDDENLNEATDFKPFDELAKEYGYSVDDEGNIIGKKGKTGVVMSVKAGRVRMESSTGDKLFTGPNKPQALESFLKSFWYATKVVNEECDKNTMDESPIRSALLEGNLSAAIAAAIAAARMDESALSDIVGEFSYRDHSAKIVKDGSQFVVEYYIKGKRQEGDSKTHDKQQARDWAREFVGGAFDRANMNEGQKLLTTIKGEKNPDNVAKVYKDSDTGEFVVKFWENGKYNKNADAFETDRDGAVGTANAVLKKLDESTEGAPAKKD